MASLTASGEDNQLLCTVRKYFSNESASANVSGTGNVNQSRFLSTQDNFGEELPQWKSLTLIESVWHSSQNCPHKQNRFPMMKGFGQKQGANVIEKLEENRSK